MWKIIVPIIVVLVAVVILFAVPLKTVAYDVNVPYEEVETYVEKEPFQRIETYVEKEPYILNVPAEYRVIEASSSNWFFTSGSDLWVTILNADTQSGTFNVVFDITLRGGAKATQSGSNYIAIGQQKTILVKYSGAAVDRFTYNITPPSKTVTSVRDVQKQRTVTDYRDVQKQRTITKVRIETQYKNVPLLP